MEGLNKMKKKGVDFIRYHGIGDFEPFLYSKYEDFAEDVKKIQDNFEGVTIGHEIGHSYKAKSKVSARVVFDVMVDKIKADPDSEAEKIRKNLENSLKGTVELLRMG